MAVSAIVDGYMDRQKINLVSATVSIVLALQALVVVLLAVTTGWDRQLMDEGPAAHIFQILIVAQIPFALVFLATADWKRLRQVAQPVAFQAAILAVTFATAKLIKL
jgi:hypothetical protein